MDHRDVLVKALAGEGYPVTLISDSISWWKANSGGPHSGKALDRIQRIWQQLAGTNEPGYMRYALDLIDRNRINTVVAYWGTLPLPDILGLKRARPSVRFVLHLLCHPLGLTFGRIAMQNMIFRNAVRGLDGIIYSSSAMQEYVETKILGRRRVPGLLYKPCWTSDYLAADGLEELHENPNIIYLGRMDWRHAQPCDDVRALLTGLMEEGINVHFSMSNDGGIEHPHARPFEPLSLKEIPAFGSQFDASLVAYNMGAVPCADRFDNTVPDRLITSVCLGVPIAVPSEGFAASKEYLEQLDAVIVYESAADLAAQLRNRIRIRELRAKAQRNISKYTAEQKIPELLGFLSALPS